MTEFLSSEKKCMYYVQNEDSIEIYEHPSNFTSHTQVQSLQNFAVIANNNNNDHYNTYDFVEINRA